MEVFCPRLMTCTLYVCILADIFSPVRKVDGCNRAFYSNFSRFVFPLIIQPFLACAFLEYYHLLFLIQGQYVSISTFCFEFRAWNFLLMQKYHDNLTKNICQFSESISIPPSVTLPPPQHKENIENPQWPHTMHQSTENNRQMEYFKELSVRQHQWYPLR